MRIALLPDEYLPEGTRVHSKMFHDLALQLKKNGHKPIVITPGTPVQKYTLVIDFVEGIEYEFDHFIHNILEDIIEIK